MQLLKNKRSLLLRNKLLLVLLFFGTLSWSTTTIKSGLIFDFGMGFWGPNGHDGVWHLALINHLAASNLNPLIEMPTAAGAALKNYHLGFDLFVAALHK